MYIKDQEHKLYPRMKSTVSATLAPDLQKNVNTNYLFLEEYICSPPESLFQKLRPALLMWLKKDVGKQLCCIISSPHLFQPRLLS